MFDRRLTSWGLVAAAVLSGTACRTAAPPKPALSIPSRPAVSPTPQPSVTALSIPTPDPALQLIGESEQHFQAGERELREGHLEGAKRQFNLAVAVLLESPLGGRKEPRVRAHFDRLIDRISTYEVKALADGDGFVETRYEPASIDDLLAMSATLSPAASSSSLDGVDFGVHDIPIPTNQKVLAYIDLFQGRLRTFIEEGMRRGSQYLPMIQRVFKAEGLPLDLAYVPLVESAFKPNALSRAKAKGMWQFMQGTGKNNGLRQDWYIDERSDPEKATLAAAKYLAALARLFNGDWHMALASYNGGPGRLQRATKLGRTDDFWKLAGAPRLLPRETREYVPMILAAIVIARNPAQYGFEIEPQPAPQYETVSLTKPVDLRRVAEWADSTISEIQSLNPELRRWTTPVRDHAYSLRVPTGAAEVVRARFEESAGEDLTSLNWYTVKAGDTVPGVAKKLRVGRSELAAANYLGPRSVLSAGQRLIIPREATTLMAARTDRPVPAVDARPLQAEPFARGLAPTSADRIRVVYEVKRGDTLASIARVFRTSVASLRTWNRLSGSQIHTGERLTIYRAVRAD
jgi:membrane-bound lytic murein transglycosylase D